MYWNVENQIHGRVYVDNGENTMIKYIAIDHECIQHIDCVSSIYYTTYSEANTIQQSSHWEIEKSTYNKKKTEWKKRCSRWKKWFWLNTWCGSHHIHQYTHTKNRRYIEWIHHGWVTAEDGFFYAGARKNALINSFYTAWINNTIDSNKCIFIQTVVAPTKFSLKPDFVFLSGVSLLLIEIRSFSTGCGIG